MSRFISRRALVGASIALGATAPFGAAFAQAPRTLSAGDQADVKRVEDYLNALKTFKARFLQIDNNGGTAEGTLYISRPGKLRVDYDPPNPNLLIANGSFLIHYDRQLKSPAYLSLNSTPAGLLVREHVSLSNDVVVLGVEHGPQVLRVAIAQKNDLRAGRVTFVFGEQPFILNSWQVTDAQGALTRVSLFDAQSGVKLDPALFVFRDPGTFGESGTR
jgi:outer membrane lipoprotein-sorting protein